MIPDRYLNSCLQKLIKIKYQMYKSTSMILLDKKFGFTDEINEKLGNFVMKTSSPKFLDLLIDTLEMARMDLENVHKRIVNKRLTSDCIAWTNKDRMKELKEQREKMFKELDQLDKEVEELRKTPCNKNAEKI